MDPKWIEHFVAFTGAVCLVSSFLVKILPPPDEVKDAEGKVAGWYLIVFNSLRRASLNSPYVPTRTDATPAK